MCDRKVRTGTDGETQGIYSSSHLKTGAIHSRASNTSFLLNDLISVKVIKTDPTLSTFLPSPQGVRMKMNLRPLKSLNFFYRHISLLHSSHCAACHISAGLFSA